MVIFRNYWLLGLILFVGLFLRVNRLDYLELFGDELDAGYQSYSLLTTGRDYKGHWWPTYMQSFSEWRAPGLMYLMVSFIKLFGLNEWGVRMGPAFMGVISIGLFYLLLRLLKQTAVVAMWSSFFLAILPWHIQYSRAGFELTLLAVLLIGGVLLLATGLQKENDSYLFGE
jgi:4-amino-4-deoxy-L-arabinose transferase-like glycosyltransferase